MNITFFDAKNVSMQNVKFYTNYSPAPSQGYNRPLLEDVSHTSSSTRRKMQLSTWTTWLTQALEELYHPLSTSEDSDFSRLFYSIFSPNAEMKVNHKNVPVSALEEHIKSEVVASNLVLDAQVDWKEVFDVPEGNGAEGGVVVGVFVVTPIMQLRIRTGSAETLGNRSFSAKVVRDAKGDHWRVAEFFLTDQTIPPIHLEAF